VEAKLNTVNMTASVHKRTMLQTMKLMGVDALAGRKGGGSVDTWKLS
jgi:hypothetical protein